jgi:hypothetical protein
MLPRLIKSFSFTLAMISIGAGAFATTQQA